VEFLRPAAQRRGKEISSFVVADLRFYNPARAFARAGKYYTPCRKAAGRME